MTTRTKKIKRYPIQITEIIRPSVKIRNTNFDRVFTGSECTHYRTLRNTSFSEFVINIIYRIVRGHIGWWYGK